MIEKCVKKYSRTLNIKNNRQKNKKREEWIGRKGKRGYYNLRRFSILIRDANEATP